MKNWLKSFLSSSKRQNSLITPLKKPPTFLKSPKNYLFNQQNQFNPLANPFNYYDARPLMPKSSKKQTIEKEYKNYWLEKWYVFRDKRLAYPLDTVAYAMRVAIQVVGRILLKNEGIANAYEGLKERIYQAQRNKKIREYFVPGTIFFVMIMIFLMY